LSEVTHFEFLKSHM